MIEAEKRMREALAATPPLAEVGHVRLMAVCTPENIAALLADRDEREAKLRAEVEALRADAERYRYLRVDSAMSARPVVWMCNGDAEPDQDQPPLFGNALDNAIALAQVKDTEAQR